MEKFDFWWPLETWPLTWPKNDRSSFVMILDALSNAAYCVSPHGPGAELDGGGEGPTTPGPRRGLIMTLVVTINLYLAFRVSHTVRGGVGDCWLESTSEAVFCLPSDELCDGADDTDIRSAISTAATKTKQLHNFGELWLHKKVFFLLFFPSVSRIIFFCSCSATTTELH